ncbi:hypothetical protein F4677DRAFT_459934 [Hypoxylon crocopeplum]|nr:hypothetical protein F4677DRAFT_459934 [Hypoxylon crocopeplum]
MPDWNSCPREVQLMILKLVPGSYASVCKEWQAVIEKRNFRQLKLGVSCLNDFQRMTERPRDLIEKIWLNVELLPYACRTCAMLESPTFRERNNTIVRRAIYKLYAILSTWEPTGHGLTLELSIHSGSDPQHFCKNTIFGGDDEDEYYADIESGNPLKQPTTIFDDRSHRWHEGRIGYTEVGADSILRLFEDITMPDYKNKRKLPEVHAVTSFMLRRHCRRHVKIFFTLLALIKALPQLKTMAYEPWRAFSPDAQGFRDEANRYIVEVGLPKGLKRLSVFEDFSEDWSLCIPSAVARIPQPQVARAFAQRSLQLEHLSVSFMVEAQHFFDAPQQHWAWHSLPPQRWAWDNLQSLALTSQLLVPLPAEEGQISGLLRAAGKAALHMPKLHTMALWNCLEKDAGVFLYRKGRDETSITWRGTWFPNLDRRVVQAWKKVASKYTPWELRVRGELLQGGTVKSHGDLIHALNLPPGVVDPVSLWQIRKEGLMSGLSSQYPGP